MSKYLRVHGKPWIERVLTPSLSIIYPPCDTVEELTVFGVLVYVLRLFSQNIAKRGHRCGNLCNNSCLNIYKGVLSFEKMFNVLKV